MSENYWKVRCEELEEELRQVRDVMRREIHPVVWAMGMIAPQTPSGAVTMVAALYKAYPHALSRERLMLARRACKEDVDDKVIDVQICKARQGLRRAGAEGPIIVNVYAAGYRMHAEAYAWLSERLAEARLAEARLMDTRLTDTRLTDATNLACVSNKHRG
jgi:DNA-binding winged helix-turn-helix (wHTH) protein